MTKLERHWNWTWLLMNHTLLSVCRYGRVNYVLARRLELLTEVGRFQESLGVPGDVSYTCETAGHFYLYQVSSCFFLFLFVCLFVLCRGNKILPASWSLMNSSFPEPADLRRANRKAIMYLWAGYAIVNENFSRLTISFSNKGQSFSHVWVFVTNSFIIFFLSGV